jgi:prolyl 4-hydroxylase
MITIDDFLTPEECDFLIEMGHKSGYSRSTETRKDGADFESQHRTSSNAWCRGECANNPITKRIFEKIYILTGLSSKNGELIQLLQYEPGQFYQSHHDFVAPQLRRVLTFFLYLEDEGLEGGGTQFTNLFPNEDEVISIEIAPKRGRALIWPNVLNEDPTQKDESTFHSGMPVLNGIKYAANVWFHNYDLTKGYNLNC